MVNTKVVISKALNGSAVQVSLVNKTLEVSMQLDDFLMSLAVLASPSLASDAARNAGNPALLMTNAQLTTRIKDTISVADISSTLAAASIEILASMKRSSVVAE